MIPLECLPGRSCRENVVEIQNIVIEYRWGEGKPERFPGLVAEPVGLRVDVIVTSGPHAIRAAQRATSTIPIVMAIVEDPVEQGFVASFGRPGGNLTGLSFQDPDLATKRVQLLHEAIPSVMRVAALWDSSGSGQTAMKEQEDYPGPDGEEWAPALAKRRAQCRDE